MTYDAARERPESGHRAAPPFLRITALGPPKKGGGSYGSPKTVESQGVGGRMPMTQTGLDVGVTLASLLYQCSSECRWSAVLAGELF